MDAVRRGEAGPAADPADVALFLQETFEHIHDVNDLIGAMGGRPRPVPPEYPEGWLVRGIHDFGERISVRRLEDHIERLRRSPLRDRTGRTVPMPAWFAGLAAQARARGETTVDTGKLDPHVAAGLGRRGPPDLHAIELHRLGSVHHRRFVSSRSLRPDLALIETVADSIVAMRQARVYRREPVRIVDIRRALRRRVARGDWPVEATALIERGLALQHRLEQRAGQPLSQATQAQVPDSHEQPE